MKTFHMIIEKDCDGWYVGSVSELPGCHTQARSFDQLAERMQEAISLYLEDESDVRCPDFVGVQTVTVQ